jgi:hypothetical protein
MSKTKEADAKIACAAQGEVRYGHGHTCGGHSPRDSDPDMHWCPLCRVWWWFGR